MGGSDSDSQRAEILGNEVKLDAWVGRNHDLRDYALRLKVFDRVQGIADAITPCWDDYQLVVGRCGFNTFLEVMMSRALLLTGVFESDGEWNTEILKRLSQYGVKLVENIHRDSFSDAILSTHTQPAAESESIIAHRHTVFSSGVQSLVEIVHRIVKDNR